MKKNKHPEISKRISVLINESKKYLGNMSEIARDVGVSHSSVQQWVEGLTSPRGENLQKLSVASECRKRLYSLALWTRQAQVCLHQSCQALSFNSLPK